MNKEESVLTVDSNGNQYWRNKNGDLHRTDGPAVEKANGNRFWGQNGKLHRVNGPAVEMSNGDKYWYQDGERHRTDGLAVELSKGYKSYYMNGKLHRSDGPAIEYSNGDKYWYQNDKLHRIDGPAVECFGNKYWYLNGEFLSHREYLKAIKKIKKTENPKYTKKAVTLLNLTLFLVFLTLSLSVYLFQNGDTPFILSIVIFVTALTALVLVICEFLQALPFRETKKNKKIENTRINTIPQKINNSFYDSSYEKQLKFSEKFSKNLKVIQNHDLVEAKFYEKRMTEVMALKEKAILEEMELLKKRQMKL